MQRASLPKIAVLLAFSSLAMNCSGKTYSTFFQPFDLVFGAQSSSNSSVNGNLIAATPLTNTRVMLTFSKPVTLASGQTVANYRITGPNGNLLQILAASRDPNNSSIIFIDTIPQAAGSAYTVTVSGITFVDNASLGNATASFTAPNNADQTGPEFSSVSVTAATASAATLEVFFNEAVGQSVDDATFGGYFDLYTNSGCSTGHIDVTSAARDSSNYAKVTLTTANPLTAGIEYYACATTNVRDIWGNSKTTVIANGAVIVSSSFVYTAPTPRVTSAVSTSSTSVLVTFDQAMGTTGLTTTGNPGNYTFSSCGALANNTTGATITALNGNTQVLLTGLSAGTAGTCRVTVNTAVRSALGAPLTAQTNSAIFSYTTTDSTPPVVVSVAPTKRTVPTNLNPTNNIRVTFSEPIDLASVSTTAPFSDFSFSPALNIVSVNCTNTPVPYCDVETADQTTQSYGLTVSGISDPTGNALATSTTTFTGDGRPYIIAIYPVDTTTVMVQWSEPIGPRSDVDDTNSADGFDYSISPLVATDISEVRLFPTGGALSDYSAFVRIRLATAMTPGTSYTLAYSDTAPTGGTDASNNPPLTTVPNGGTFTGPGATSTAKPYIVSASSTATTTVIVNFNEPISNANLDPADFTLGGGSVCPNGTPASATQIAAGVVQLVVTAGTGGAGITCSVAVVADKFFDLLGNGNSATTPPHIEYSYSGTGAGADTTAPTIASIVSLSNTRIQVFFSEPMKTDPNGMDTLSLYSSSPALTFASVGTCVNGSTSCIINTSAQTAANYTLSISAGIQDSNNVATTGTITGTFIGTGGSATAPTLFMATLINSTTVELSFSEAMGLTSVECTSTGTCSGKYTVTGGNSVSAAVRQADPTKVRLTITPGAYGSSNSYTVTAAGVQDTAGNTIGTPNSATFSGSASAPNTTTLAAASDTGTLGDNITGAAFPSPGLQFTGTVAANTTVVLYLNGAPVATAVSGPTGAYTVTLTDGSGIVQGNGNVFTLTTVGPTGLVSDISPSLTITYDSNAPTVTTGLGNGVTSTLADGTYGIGQVIPITVKFSETVTVSGTPQLTIVRITPATTAAVNYASGSGTDTLTFNYTVLSGDSSSDLDYQATNSLALNGGTITDTAGNPAVLTLPAGAGSLASNKALVLNGVISGTITYDQSGITTGPFRTGTLTITATYASAPGSTPTIAIDQQGTNDIAATAMSGGPNVFTYSYTVNAAGGANADGTATITLSTPSVPATPTFVIDTTNPVAPAGITPPTYTNTTTATNVTYTNGTDTNFSTHNVRACTSNDCATGCVGQTTDAASPVDVSGLTNGTAYYICVQSVDTAGNISAYVASATTVTVDTTAPTAASGVSVPTYTQATNQDVTFTAGTDTNITTSNVRMCTSNDCTTGCVGATTGNSPTNVASLVNGTAYYGCVQSRDLAGNTSAWTASGTTVTVDTTNPAAPSGVSVPTYVNATSVNVTFTNGTDTNFSTHNLKACTSNDCATGCVGATTDAASPATISGLTTGTAYYACVQSVDLAGRTSSFVPSGATVTVDTTNPAAPSGVTVPTYTNTTSVVATYTNGTDTNFSTHNIKACTSNDCATGCVGAATDAASTSTISSLVNGTAYYACIQSVDLATNTSAFVASAATVTVDTTTPTGYSVAIDQTYINNGNRTAISFTFTGAEVGTTYNYTFSSTGGGTNVTGNGTVASAGQQITGINLNGLGDGTVTLSVTLTDGAGNVGTAATNNKTKDTVLPVISAVSPTANFSNTNVSYTLSEVCQSGSITWTRTGGTADGGGSPAGTHTQALTGSELNAGTFTGTITNNPTLVDGTTYNITWNCTDLAGNVATTVTQSNLTYSPGNLVITSAETLDTDNDGKIDTYRLSFNKPVKDDTFNGYSANNLGSVTTQWLVAGYTNVRMIHGTHLSTTTSGAYTDTANDAVIYLRFDENVQTCSSASQVGCDTDAKPDVTTTGTTISDFVQTSTLAQLSTGTVTEADGSKPVLIAARSLSTTTADAIFSEPVDTTTAQTITNYTISGGTNPTVSAATRDGTNTNIVHLTTGTQTGGQAYTLTVNTNVKDLANLSMNASANTANFTGVQNPVVSSVVTASATTLTITFNESVTAASTECSTTTACAAIFDNTSIPILSAVSTAGAGNNAATYTLTVNPMVEGQSYTVTVLQNTVTSVATGNKMLNTNNSATFNGDGKPGATISTTDMTTGCAANSARRVYVQYDQAVSATATTIANYKITNCISGNSCPSGGTPTGSGAPNSNGAASVTNLTGNKYAVDFTDDFGTDSTLYQLTISGVQDANGNTIAAPGNLTFQCGDDTTAPVLVGATVVSATAGSTVVLLTFSEAVDNGTANVASNYTGDFTTPAVPPWGTSVLSAARQSNTAQVLVTFQPALANGGHQVGVRNVTDLKNPPTANVISNLGLTNVQPIIVNAPTGFSGGPVFTDPFGDGTAAGQMILYDDKIILGWDGDSSKFFEMNKSLTVAQTIVLDADGNSSGTINKFKGYGSTGGSGTLQGLDAINAGCVGGTSTPFMTGSTCSGASGTEYVFAGGFNLTGSYQSVFRTTDKTSSTTTFTFTERGGLDQSSNTLRSMTMVLYNNYLYVASPHIGSFAPRVSRVCALPSGSCGNGETSWNTPTAIEGRFFPTIGKGAVTPNSTGVSNPKGSAVAIDTMYEYDSDGTGGTSCSGASCPSALYMVNGGRYFGALGGTRTSTTRFDGGIIRSRPNYSAAGTPPGCNGLTNAQCDTNIFETITPSSADWLNYVSIPLPYLTIATADWENMLPSNRIIPAMKAVPYMRTAPNGDLYMIRNGCATIKMQTVCMTTGSCNGGAPNALTDTDIPNGYTVAQTVDNNFTANFATTATGRRQVCPPGYEVPQLWVLPKSSGGTLNGSAQWQLVASRTFTPQTYPNGSALPSRKSTTLSGNTTTCGTAPNNKCERNAHITLLEFVGSYLYLGFDNQDHGANIWRVNMNSATCTGSAPCTTGLYPAEGQFTIVNDVLGLDGSSTNQRIFSHLTVNDSGKDWLILATRDGTNSMKIYRTANDQN